MNSLVFSGVADRDKNTGDTEATWHYIDVIMGAMASHQRIDCLFGHRSRKASKLRVTGLCAQMASNAENVSI